MRKSVAVLSLAGGLLCAGRGTAGEHLASPEAVRSRLGAAAVERQQALASLDRFLSSPGATSAARTLGADLIKVNASLAALTDDEVKDLAARAESLASDPAAAGLDPDVRQLLVIFLIVAIVILVLKAVD